MSANPFARPPACPLCNDTRQLTKHVSARQADVVPCDKCGAMDADEYDRFRRDAWLASQKPPEISQLDLTDEERLVFQRMKQEHPTASPATRLSWIEGQRYDPAKDEEFLNQARDEFRKWRDARDKADAEWRATHP